MFVAEFFSEGLILSLCTEALYLILLLSAPMLIAALGVGLIISILQATTQIQEQTLSFVPKIVATFVAVIACGTWIAGLLSAFTIKIMKFISRVGLENL
jgi:flagellar biosynthetic protein FliQ